MKKILRTFLWIFLITTITLVVIFVSTNSYFKEIKNPFAPHIEAETEKGDKQFIFKNAPDIKKENVGLLMFRGNPERNFYGTGPLPTKMKTIWKYPKNGDPMCMTSTSFIKTSVWCGSGWTGQPVVWEKEDGTTEIIFGAYDGAFHFVDAETGENTRRTFQTGDIIKGSATLDKEFPLLYAGSRDNKFRIFALDRKEVTEIWALDADKLIGIWNNDWDGNPALQGDYLFEGGENGWFYIFKLNRSLGDDGLVRVSPEMIFSMASYNDELIENIGDKNVSIENSPVIFRDRVYFANSGGRVIGLDISKLDKKIVKKVFDYWVGDDTDGTIVVDKNGMLYVSVELERGTKRSEELGQFIKLNPYRREPFMWGIHLPKENADYGGIWSTPAWYKSTGLFITTNSGYIMQVDKNFGNIVWKDFIGEHAWSSPVIVDHTLLVANCNGELITYNIGGFTKPNLISTYKLSESCIESTPAVWKGNIYVGARDGYFYKIGSVE